MTLAAADDANRYLDDEKVRFETEADAAADALVTDRYVTSVLFDVFGAQVSTWAVEPGTGEVQAPVAVTEIAAMLMASYRYAKKYSLETDTENTYANRLKMQADEWLEKIRNGQMSLIEAEIVSGLTFSNSDFWPNNLTVDDADQPNRKFWMDMVF